MMYLLVGFLVVAVASAITNRGNRMGCLSKTILGFFALMLSQFLFGDWGPQLAGVAIVPAILSAVILLTLFWKRDR